jgi:hypothetical protein
MNEGWSYEINMRIRRERERGDYCVGGVKEFQVDQGQRSPPGNRNRIECGDGGSYSATMTGTTYERCHRHPVVNFTSVATETCGRDQEGQIRGVDAPCSSLLCKSL